jgi:hypothetical protein
VKAPTELEPQAVEHLALLTLSLIPQWPSCEPVLQQIKHAVESSFREVHLRCLRQTIQSNPPAQVSAPATDLRPNQDKG